MSKNEEGSLAPTERVNIVYRPATGGAKEEVELPLKMLVLGDFTGVVDDRPVEERQPVTIDKDNFDDVLKAQNVRLEARMADRLSGMKDSEIPVSLSFPGMDDFGPERVAEQIPQIQALINVRNALTALKAPLANIPEFRNKLQTLVKDPEARRQMLQELGIPEEEAHHG